VRNKAADTARLSSRAGQQSELGLMLPSSSTTRPPGQGITLTEDEQAAAQLYAIGSLLQGNTGAISPLTAQQQAAVYVAGGGSNSDVFVNRRTPAGDDGQCRQRNYYHLLRSCLKVYEIFWMKWFGVGATWKSVIEREPL